MNDIKEIDSDIGLFKVIELVLRVELFKEIDLTIRICVYNISKLVE